MRTDETSTLKSLNTLLALAVGTDSALASEIQSAIEFSRSSQAKSLASEPRDLSKTAEQLLKLHLQQSGPYPMQCLDLSQAEDDPLFIRSAVLHSLHKLAGYENVILLIAGLRNVACPPNKRYTKKRRARYHELRDTIETIAVVNITPRTKLRILFI